MKCTYRLLPEIGEVWVFKSGQYIINGVTKKYHNKEALFYKENQFNFLSMTAWHDFHSAYPLKKKGFFTWLGSIFK